VLLRAVDGDEANGSSKRTDRTTRARGVDELVPGIEGPGVTRYRTLTRYLPTGDCRPRRCVVLVTDGRDEGRAHAGSIGDRGDARGDPVPG